MQIWHYHPDTKELLGAGTADAHPIEGGEWLHPAHSTPAAPPAPREGQATVFSGSGWSSVPDHRGETWWMADAKLNTQPLTITSVGDPAGWTPPLTNVEPPAPPPPAPLPVTVSPRQVRQALTLLGLRDAVETAVQAGDQDVRDNWQYGEVFIVGNNLVEAALEAVGTAPADVALVFTLAKTL